MGLKHAAPEQSRPTMYDRILFPTDGSEGAATAREHAIDLAETYSATLHILYVADTNRDSLTTIGNQVVDALEQEGATAVSEASDHAQTHGIDVVDDVLQGDPYETIRDYAESHEIDIVVMATHGRRGLDRYLMGSVTEKVIRTADVPVLTVRMPEENH